ncbi:MAG: NAD(P)H-dependent oxidoreductase [Anaerolineales bacterium]|nr:NAD(P)H-dependent oxidoreductase [Anaerolineales bacterium]
MKEIPTIREVLDNLFAYMIKDYDGSEIIEQKEILFDLNHGGENFQYTLVATPEKLDLRDGRVDGADLTVRCSAFDWLDIAGENLNPVIGAITGRVKFIGDIKILSTITSGSSNGRWKKIIDAPQDYEFPDKRKWIKPEKVLAISGSPRGTRGYTHALLEPVLEGMRAQGVDVEMVVLSKKQIHACTGCWTCWTQADGECAFRDDMKNLSAKIQEADIVVYAFPIYVDSVPGILKNLLDRQTRRFYPYMVPGISKTRHPRRVPKEQYYVVLSTCGFPEIVNFDPIVCHFEAISHNHHAPVIAYLLSPQGNNYYENPLYYPQLIEKITALKKAGEQIVLNGKVDKKILKIISASTPRKKMTQWRANASLYWQSKIDEKSQER